MSRILLKPEHLKFMDILCSEELTLEQVTKRMFITERHQRYIKEQVTITYETETFLQATIKHTKELLAKG